MAKKITQLPAAAAAASTQILEIVNDPSGTPESQKLSISQIITLLDTRYPTFPVSVAHGGTGLTTFGGTNRILYTTTTDTLSSIATANTSALVTSNAGAPSWVSGGTANRVLRTDGTTVSFSQVALATDVSGTLLATNGGTGNATVTTGDLLYGSAANTWSKLAGVATGNALIAGGIGVAPAWGKIGLATHVSGILTVPNGGTGVGTIPTGQIPFGNGVGAISTSARLTYNGTDTLKVQQVIHCNDINNPNNLDIFLRFDSNSIPTLDLNGHASVDPEVGKIVWYDKDTDPTTPYGFMTLLNSSGTPLLQVGTGESDGGGKKFEFNLSTGDLLVTGKLTANGGVDPPYMMFDLETRDSIKALANKVPDEKKGGSMVFLNSATKKLEAYIPSDDKFYTISGDEQLV